MPPNQRKRQTSSSMCALPRKKSKTTKKSEQIHIPRCAFLDLPPELRNKIYEYVAIESVTVLHPCARGKLSNSSPLCRLSRQVHDEFMDMLHTAAPEIKALVKDFNFSHVIRFLHRLSDRELDTLPTLDKPSLRRFVIELEVTSSGIKNPEGLLR